MHVDCIFEWNDFSFSPTNTFCKFFAKIKEQRPDIQFNFVDAVKLRVQAEKVGLYLGPNCKFGPMYMMVACRETNKFFLISYWDTIKDIFECPSCGFSLSLMQELITTPGVVVDDIRFKPISYLKYTPFSYVPAKPEIETSIEVLYNQNLPKTNPDKPRFRNFPNDPFRMYIMKDERFDGIDKRDNMLMPAEYMAELNSHKINISINGHAEVCFRDMEILGLGNVLLRTKFVGKFHNELIPNYHYIAIDVDDYEDHKTIADKIINKYNEVKDDAALLNFIGNNGREWYLKNGTAEANADILIKILDFNKLK